MPGERERIEYGLSKRSNDDIVKLVKGASKTVEGLEALTKIFPKELMPAKRTVVCGRCEKEYDPQVPGDNVCREEHPYEFVKTIAITKLFNIKSIGSSLKYYTIKHQNRN